MVEVDIEETSCVFVEWVDSTSPSYPDTWISKEDIEGLSPSLIHTCGFLHENREDYITVVSSTSEESVSGVISIPKSAILSIVALREIEESDD